MYRTVTTSYGPAHSRAPVVDASGRPFHRTWEYFDLDDSLRATNPVAAAIVSIAKTFGFLLCAAVAVPASLFHPVLTPLGLAIIALALKTSARKYGVWHGDCPHCRQEIWVTAKRRDSKAFDCRLCGDRILFEAGRFLPG